MIGMVAAAALLAPLAQQATSEAGAPIDLFCQGRGDRYVNGNRPQVTTAIRIKIAGNSGQALVPDELLSPDDARGWHDLKNLNVSEDRIDGKITFSWIFAPVFSIDRRTKVMRMTGSLANFSGTCRPYDPRTARMPVAPSRPAGPAPAADWAAPRPAAPAGVRSDWATPARPAAPAAARPRTPGTFVLAKFKGQPNWYPAQVLKAAGNLVTVQYASGTQEALPASLVADLTWKAGSYIECKIDGTTFSPVTIVEMRPAYAISVVTNQGKRFATTMRSCRTTAR